MFSFVFSSEIFLMNSALVTVLMNSRIIQAAIFNRTLTLAALEQLLSPQRTKLNLAGMPHNRFLFPPILSVFTITLVFHRNSADWATLDDKTVSRILSLVPNLTSLNLKGCIHVSHEGIEGAFQNMPHLKVLSSLHDPSCSSLKVPFSRCRSRAFRASKTRRS